MNAGAGSKSRVESFHHPQEWRDDVVALESLVANRSGGGGECLSSGVDV